MATNVVIGRFQVASLHPGHHHVIDAARGFNRENKVVILLGYSRAMPDKRNPLPLNVRMQMLMEEVPDADIIPLPDHRTNEEWSAYIDNVLTPYGPVTLYGGRDSSLDAYSGKHPKKNVKQLIDYAGTMFRSRVAATNSTDFRKGMIHAQNICFPRTFPTVDMIVWCGNDVLLGRKHDETMFRFPGGFVDVNDASYEHAAQRELEEETGLSLKCNQFRYMGSILLNEWRYRGSCDKIKTIIFVVRVGSEYKSCVKGNDDLAEVKWVPYEEVFSLLVPEHQRIMNTFFL